MELETQVSPGEETQNPAPVQTDEALPDVVDQEPETPEKDEAAPEDPSAKAVKNLQRRIDRLTATKYQTQAEVNQARAEAEQLRQRLAQYEQPEQPQQQGPDPITLAKEIARIEKVTEKANAIAKQGAEKFPNFREAVQVVNREAGSMFDQYGRSTPFGEAVLSADDPAAVIHAIGTDPDLAAELADLSPIQQARRIARLEIELSKPKEPPKSTAPKPLTPIKANKPDNGLSDNLPIDEWQRRFLAERAKR